MSTYSIKNSKSRIRSIRVPLEDDDHMVQKAKANPDNDQNQVATEVNALIRADAAYTKRTGKFKFQK